MSELFEASIISSFNSARKVGENRTKVRTTRAGSGHMSFQAVSICSKRLESSGSCDRMSALCLGFCSVQVTDRGDTVAEFPHLAKTHEDGLQAAPVGLHLGPDAESSVDGAQLAAPLVHHGLACAVEAAKSGWHRIIPNAAKLQNSMNRPCEVMPIISSESLSNFSITSPGPWQG